MLCKQSSDCRAHVAGKVQHQNVLKHTTGANVRIAVGQRLSSLTDMDCRCLLGVCIAVSDWRECDVDSGNLRRPCWTNQDSFPSVCWKCWRGGDLPFFTPRSLPLPNSTALPSPPVKAEIVSCPSTLVTNFWRLVHSACLVHQNPILLLCICCKPGVVRQARPRLEGVVILSRS